MKWLKSFDHQIFENNGKTNSHSIIVNRERERATRIRSPLQACPFVVDRVDGSNKTILPYLKRKIKMKLVFWVKFRLSCHFFYSAVGMRTGSHIYIHLCLFVCVIEQQQRQDYNMHSFIRVRHWLLFNTNKTYLLCPLCCVLCSVLRGAQ